jgi:hypothetical protein
MTRLLLIRRLVTLACVLAAPGSALRLGAQDSIATAPRRVVRRIEVVRQDVYDSSEATFWTRRTANQLHVRTQMRVVNRELLLREGDLLDSAKAAETGRNLRRLQVFRDVIVDTSSDGSTLRVTTKDGWSTRPYATLRSVGGQRLISAGLFENNLFGLAATLDLRFVQDPDRSLLRVAVGAPRIISNRISSGVFFNRLSDGRSFGAVVEQPFFSLSSRNAVRAGFVVSDGRVLRFRDGVTNRPADSLNRRFALATVTASHALRASPRGYLRLGAEAQYRRDDFVPRRIPQVVFSNTQTGAVTAFVDASAAKYLVTRNYRAMGQPEDIDLSSTVRVGLAAAPAAFGYTRSAVGPVLFGQTGVRIPKGFASVAGRATGLLSGGQVDSGTATVSGTIALQPSPKHLLVAFTMAGWERNPFPGEEFDLGFTRGPRAFKIHAFTGDRQRFSAIEYRWTAIPNIAGVVAAGVAAFAERGGAWYAGTRPRYGSDAGIGLRIAPLRDSPAIGATRLDFARRFANDRLPAGWVFVIGTGFTFDALR